MSALPVGEFRNLWAAQTVSALGTGVSMVALPLTAIVVLGAGPVEMGILVALQQVPVPLFGLFAGVWVDRVRRRPILVAGQFGRALLLASIPIAALLGVLTLAQLYVVAFLVGTFKVCFDLATTSYLPTVLPRPELIRGNTALTFSDSVANFSGRGLGGALVQATSAPLAIAVDALSYVVSGFCVLRIRAPEPHAERSAPSEPVWREIHDGFQAVLRQPVIASMIATSTLGAFGGAITDAVLVLFMSRDLGLSPFWLGIFLAVGPVAALPAAALTTPCAKRFGPGPTLILASAILSAGAALLPLAGGGALRLAGTLGAGQALLAGGLTLYSITQISLRQALTPDHLLGRVNATRRVIVFGVIPIGALVGGAIGEASGLRAALCTAAAFIVLSLCVAALSPLRGARVLPADPVPAG